jgi:hypothetical protein
VTDAEGHQEASMSNTVRDATDNARDAAESDQLEVLARGGLIAYGVVHILIGVIALQIAWGSTRANADQSGALQSLAENPFGTGVLWLVAVGLAALAVWQGSQAIWSNGGGDAGKRARRRVSAGAKTVVYVALAVSAARYALGSGTSSSETQQSTTRALLELPFGQVLIVVAALALIVLGAWEVRKAAKKSFLEHINGSMPASTRRAVTRLGQVGYAAKGIAVAVVGLLLGYAALTFEPSKAQGLDGAMRAIAMQPFGQLLLTAVGAGFAAFGIFAFAQARYRSM